MAAEAASPPLSAPPLACDSGSGSCTTSSACSRCQGSSQRVGAKSSEWRSPSGQFSSDLSGCSTTSTSSMTPMPALQMPSSSTARAACAWSDGLSSMPSLSMRGVSRMRRRTRSPSVLRFLGYWPVSSRWSNSSSLSMKALTAAGVESTTARSLTAACILASSSGVTEARRSNVKDHTGLCSGGGANAPRSTASEKRRRGDGTIWVMSCVPSPRSSASTGAMTVVLPSPMSIWWHMERPAAAPAASLEMRDTCGGRSTMPPANSKTRTRGSSTAPAPPITPAPGGAPAGRSATCARRKQSVRARVSETTRTDAAASATPSALPPSARLRLASAPCSFHATVRARAAKVARETRSRMAVVRESASDAAASLRSGLSARSSTSPRAHMSSSASRLSVIGRSHPVHCASARARRADSGTPAGPSPAKESRAGSSASKAAQSSSKSLSRLVTSRASTASCLATDAAVGEAVEAASKPSRYGARASRAACEWSHAASSARRDIILRATTEREAG
mmetsp:Transcript_10580/g.35134  ORF Transcript_10580/g.35134 Transcript_10580/m.35134 type:complete len:509 (-) Transcript_10580:2022-3548(-)